MRRGTVIIVAGLVALAGCGNDRNAEFRDAYEARATYGDEFAERPPELTDEQIDAAFERVCASGEPSLDAADEIGRSLAGGTRGSSALGSAIFQTVRQMGCP